MAYKFEKLEIWQSALEYIDLIFVLGENYARVKTSTLKLS